METLTDDQLKLKCSKYRDGAFEFQKRRHEDWKENYELYRDKVITNRLTQRQSVNVPIMKETLITMLSKTDDAPDIVFEERSNDKQKEIFKNAYWDEHFEKEVLELKDIVDKKQVYLYGRSFKKFNIAEGRITVTIEDPHDIFVDRFCDPTNIDTARFIGHLHIYRSLSEIESNPAYDKAAVSKLKNFYATAEGVIASGENKQALIEKNQRMADMGDTTVENPEVGETIVELQENYIKLWNETDKEFQWNILIMSNSEILLKDTAKNILGANIHPFTTWASDLERTDFWSDGIADIVRTPNKVINAWFSQLVENRTLRNFGMNYYDSTKADNFVPQTFEPAPWGWYPVPGNPNDIVKKIDIPDLSDSLDEMGFIIQMVERSTGATATEKGQKEAGQITLGEVKLLAEKAMDRITSLSKFYRRAWKEYAVKWNILTEANHARLKTLKLVKRSYKGNLFEKEISPKMWKSESGYEVRVTSSSEQEKEQMGGLEKLNAIAMGYPENLPLQKILLKRKLDIAKLNPEEEDEIMKFEEELNTKKEQVQQQMIAENQAKQKEAQAEPPGLEQIMAGVQPQEVLAA